MGVRNRRREGCIEERRWVGGMGDGRCEEGRGGG
jgi:hypothetical protein